MKSALLTPGTVEYEAARIGAAFGVSHWKKRLSSYKGVTPDGTMIRWTIQPKTAKFFLLAVGKTNIWYVDRWYAYIGEDGACAALMARGLYSLDFSDESILSQFPSLTAHEKLEAMLSMPREFWPQKWLDEANPQ